MTAYIKREAWGWSFTTGYWFSTGSSRVGSVFHLARVDKQNKTAMCCMEIFWRTLKIEGFFSAVRNPPVILRRNAPAHVASSCHSLPLTLLHSEPVPSICRKKPFGFMFRRGLVELLGVLASIVLGRVFLIPKTVSVSWPFSILTIPVLPIQD